MRRSSYGMVTPRLFTGRVVPSERMIGVVYRVIRPVVAVLATAVLGGCTSNDGMSSIDITTQTVAAAVEQLYLEGFLEPEIDYNDPVLRNRQLFLIGDLDEAAAQRLNRSFAYLDAVDPGEPITLYLHTDGCSSCWCDAPVPGSFGRRAAFTDV